MRQLFDVTRPGVVMAGIGLLFLAVVALSFLVRGTHRVQTEAVDWIDPEGDPQRGRVAIEHYGCGACHTIPGVRNANARVGPRLDGFEEQSFIAGMLINTPENLTRWIQNPQEINPGTAMPDLGVSEEEARHIAAYLYTADE